MPDKPLADDLAHKYSLPIVTSEMKAGSVFVDSSGATVAPQASLPLTVDGYTGSAEVVVADIEPTRLVES